MYFTERSVLMTTQAVLKGVTGLLTNVLSATFVSRLILNLRSTASASRSRTTAITSHELHVISTTALTSA